MHVRSVTPAQCFLSEYEKQERIAARGDQPPPEPAELFFEAGLALAIPLILALSADLTIASRLAENAVSFPWHLSDGSSKRCRIWIQIGYYLLAGAVVAHFASRGSLWIPPLPSIGGGYDP